MAEPYMKQLETPMDAETARKVTNFLNPRVLKNFEDLTGVNISKPGDQVPESGGMPQLFILDEKDPANPRRLEEAKVEVGSMLFWEMAHQGKLFALPPGKKEPVQLQLKVVPGASPEFSVSEPLSVQPDKLASRGFQYPEEPPKPEKLPKSVPQPGLWARIAHRLNANWYKKEHEDFQKYRQTVERIKEKNRLAAEQYRQKAQQAKQAAEDACRKVSEGLEAAFGARRTPQLLEEEKKSLAESRKKRIEERAKAEAEEKRKADAAAAEARTTRTTDRISNMVSVYGPTSKPVEKLIGKAYQKESFSILEPIALPQDMKIGDKTVDDRLFANLALHAQLKPEIARELMEQQTPNYKQRVLDEGLTEKEADDMIIQSAGVICLGDFLADTIRPSLDNQFAKRTKPGRESAKQALDEYRKGNKGPLAEIIVSAADLLARGAVNEYAGGMTDLTHAKLTGELLDLLDEDPELEAEARKKGLTDKTVETCRGMDALRELEDKSLKAEETLQKAVSEHRELSREEKRDCLKNIFKFRTAHAMLRQQAADESSKLYMTAKKRLNDRTAATEAANRTKDPQPMPEGMKPMDKVLATDLCACHYRPKLFKTPSIYKTLAENRERAEEAVLEGEQPKPDDLDKIAEMTVDGLQLDQQGLPPEKRGVPMEELDTASLANRLVGGNGPQGKTLLGEQGKLLTAQERAKQQEEAAERELNEAVIYEPGGLQC